MKKLYDQLISTRFIKAVNTKGLQLEAIDTKELKLKVKYFKILITLFFWEKKPSKLVTHTHTHTYTESIALDFQL
jgi:hypothetical protein